ncbi:MAG: hypothetical protein RLZZ292_1108 [Bacteroidota bacterium]|jgi:tetratricopeptide (TPR) repeat protein
MNQPTLLLSFAANDLEGVKAEADNIWEAAQNPTIKTRRIDDATIETMTESIIDAGQDLFMFHFGGHADPNGIVLNGFQNIDKIRFSRLLMPNDQASLQVVFLNGCLSYGHVGVLTAKGVKAIIATNVDVKDKEAVRISAFFYTLFFQKNYTLKNAFETAEATVAGKNSFITVVNPGEIDEGQAMPSSWTLFVHASHIEVMDWKLADFLVKKEGKEANRTTASIPRFLTTQPFQSGFFVGREKDLEAIDAEFQVNHRSLVLVSGEGGIGKTALIANYWFTHQARYKHLAWIFADGGVANALLSLATTLGISFEVQEKEAAQLERVVASINNLDAPCLLVFDNANNATDLEKHFVLLQKLSNCHIILTSRVTELGDLFVYRVKSLDNAAAVLLFKQHYPKYSEADAPLLDSLLHAVGFNTLVIELLAKNLAVFNTFQTNYSLSSLLTDLQRKGLFEVQNKAVKSTYQSDNLRSETPDNLIAAMYDLSDLSEMEAYLLSNFALLPAEPISYQCFAALIEPEDTGVFEENLKTLQQKGWIEYVDATQSFKTSPVIQYITKLKNKAHLYADAEILIDALMMKLDPDLLHEDNYRNSTLFAHYGESVVAALEEEGTDALAGLCEGIGTYYTKVGNLEKAIGMYEKYNKIATKLYENAPENQFFKDSLAISYGRLGNMYSTLGDLEKSLTLYENYHRLEEELTVAYPNKVDYQTGLAISYSKLGEIHGALGNIEKSVSFYEKQVILSKAIYEKELILSQKQSSENPTADTAKSILAFSYEKLASIYTTTGNLEEALPLYQEQCRLMEELYAAHPENVEFKNNLAIAYSQFGETHSNLGDCEQALLFYEKGLSLADELYAAYPMNVEFKNGVAIGNTKAGDLYNTLEDFDKVLPCYEKANTLLQELYDSNPTNVEYKHGLSLSFSKLGDTYFDLGELEKAVTLYETHHRLEKELYTAYPTNVEYAYSFAVSYSKLGEIHCSLEDDLEKGLPFYEERFRLIQALYSEHPTNVSFKNGFAVTHSELADTYSDLDKFDKALPLYEAMNTLYQELYSDHPLMALFKTSLAMSYSRLGDIHTNLGDAKKAEEFYKEGEKV